MTRALGFVALAMFACEVPAPPDSGVAPDGAVSTLPAPTRPPCLELIPPSVDFGEVELTGSGLIDVEVVNNTEQSRMVSTLPRSSPFRILPLDQFSVEIPARGRRTFSVGFSPFDALLHLGTIELNSAPLVSALGVQPCTASLPVRGLGSGTVLFEPAVLDFGFVPVGQRKTLDVQLTNTRREPVTVGFLRLEERSDAGEVFFSTDLEPGAFELAATSSRTIRLTASPPVDLTFAAQLVAITPHGDVRARLSVTGGGPVAELSPQVVDVPLATFEPGYRGPPSFVQRIVHVRNVSTSGRSPEAALVLVPPEIVAKLADGGASAELEVVGPDPRLFRNGLALGEETDLLVRFTPRATGARSYRLELFTNDPVQPVHAFTVNVGGVETFGRCSMRVEPLGDLYLSPLTNGRARGEITFTNFGRTRCVVDDPRLVPTSDPAYSIVNPSTGFVVEPGETHTLIVEGPRTVFAIDGTIGFQVLNPGSAWQFISLHVPP